jgi:hypothetical protein
MAAYNVLFISEEKLKSYTSIHESVSPEDLTPYVLQAQDIYLMNYLGMTFYQQLKDQIIAGQISIPNKFLLDNYIGQILVNYAMYHALPFLKYKIFNKSILSPDAEHSGSIDLNELKFLQNEVRTVAESYVDQMQIYLNNRSSLYPAYANYNTNDGQAPDRKTPYFSGLQTNSQFFNWRKYKNYPYGNGTQPGWSTSYNNGDQQCYGCGDWATN